MRTIKLIALIMVLGTFSANAQQSKKELSAAKPLVDLVFRFIQIVTLKYRITYPLRFSFCDCRSLLRW